MTEGQLLDQTRVERVEAFIRNIDENYDQFADTVIAGCLCKIPRKNLIPYARFYLYRVRLPIGFESTTKYRIRVKRDIYDLYKMNSNYYFIETPYSEPVTDYVLNEFMTTIQFSFVFYLVYHMLLDLKNQGTTVRLEDQLFHGLLDHFSEPDGSILITLSKRSIPDKEFVVNHLYLSLFN